MWFNVYDLFHKLIRPTVSTVLKNLIFLDKKNALVTAHTPPPPKKVKKKYTEWF
jgi:hypothetical protein